MNILAIDVGTTKFKMGLFHPNLKKICETSRSYNINLYDQGKADIDAEKWWLALCDCLAEMKSKLSSVCVVALSVTTPGLVPMAEDGRALGPAILYLDNRSREQSRRIRKVVGEKKFLDFTCNLPVSGGSSLCSILWIREQQPGIWQSCIKFGHTNTYLIKRITGEWAIDPSTTSITGLYNTAANDLRWNNEVLNLAEIPEEKLPPLVPSSSVAGIVLPEFAEQFGLPRDCSVLCGANDAVLSAWSGGIVNPGSISNTDGTCEITCVCVDKPISSPNFNVRCHVLPNRWLTFFVQNTSGKALEWFHSVFCEDMSTKEFFEDFVPSVLDDFFHYEDIDRLEQDIPEYVPFLQGSRYSLEPRTASFSRLSLETTREKMLIALIRGNILYQRAHLTEVQEMIPIGRDIVTSGGVAGIKGYLLAKERWAGPYRFHYLNQSSLLGAAMLGQSFLFRNS